MKPMTSASSSPETSQKVSLSGSAENPPITSQGSASGTVNVRPDRTVSAEITVTGINSTIAHIHEAKVGANGPVILPLTKVGDNRYVAPEGAKLTESQYAAYKAGNTYVNVHSAKFPGGELRAQLAGH